MEYKNNRLSIFISSPASYLDVFDIWFTCYRKFWANSEYSVVKATDLSVKNYPNIDVVFSGKENDGWVDRSIPFLRQIESKYILLMCDDIFIVDFVENEKIEEILNFMDKYNVHFCRLSPTKRGRKAQKNIKFLPLRMPYAKNLQFGIYNKEYLLNEFKENSETAWNVENRWNKESLLSPKGFYTDVIGIQKPIMKYVHGINKSKWYPSAINKISKLGIEIRSERRVMTRIEEIRLNFIGNIGAYFAPRFRFKIKRILKRFGIKFHTEY